MKIQQMLRLRGQKRFKNGLHFLLEFLFKALHPVFTLGIFLATDRLELGERNIRLRHGIPGLRCCLLQLHQSLRHGRKGRAIGRLHRRARCHLLHGTGQAAAPELRPLRQIRQKDLPEGGIRQLIRNSLPEFSGIL